MPENNGVTVIDSPTDGVDSRGVPLQNLQAEMSRKLAEMEQKNAERWEALNAKLEAFSAEPEPSSSDPVTIDEREELRKISASPRRYVESMIQPLREENERLKKEMEQTRILTTKGMWEKMEEVIARKEGKQDWKELPADVQNGVIGIVKEKGWGNNPSSALDAYELYQARKQKAEGSDPDRIARINAGTTEGSGRVSGKTPVRTLTRSTVEELASTHPKDSNYKKNMATLADIQSGKIKIE